MSEPQGHEAGWWRLGQGGTGGSWSQFCHDRAGHCPEAVVTEPSHRSPEPACTTPVAKMATVCFVYLAPRCPADDGRHRWAAPVQGIEYLFSKCRHSGYGS